MKDSDTAPTALPVHHNNIPAELRSLERWVGWRYAHDGKRWKKQPRNCRDGKAASVKAPATWSSFEQAVAMRGRPDGIGFVFVEGDGLVGVDLDDCRNPQTGEVEEWAVAIIRRLDTYAEVSPSGKGAKLILRGKLPPGRRRVGNIECYSDGRYFTITGQRLPGSPEGVMGRQGELDEFYREHLAEPERDEDDDEVYPGEALADHEAIELLRRGRYGAVFGALWRGDWQGQGYKSQSEGDLALCGLLTAAVGPDQDRVIRLWSQSGLSREGSKWRENPDYVTRTVRRASPWHRACEPAREGGAPPTAATAAIEAAEALAAEQEGIFRMAFKLARRLMIYFDGSDPEEYRPAVEAYCRRAGVEEQAEEYLMRVEECWGMARSPEGEGDWKWAEKQAVSQTIAVPGKGRGYRLAYTLCHNLSQIHSGQPFPLPVEKMAEFLGMGKRTGANAVKWLERDGRLRKVAEHSIAKKKAREYVFVPYPGICTQSIQSSQENSENSENSGELRIHMHAARDEFSREDGGCTEEQYPTQVGAEGPPETCLYYLAGVPCPKASCEDCQAEEEERTDVHFPAQVEAVGPPPAQEPPRPTREPPRKNALDRLRELEARVAADQAVEEPARTPPPEDSGIRPVPKRTCLCSTLGLPCDKAFCGDCGKGVCADG
jgi:hypothetical protein